MSKGLVTVFGANGFLGRHVMRELVRDGWRIRAAVRRPHIAQDLRVNGAVGQIQLIQANVRFKQSIERALEGADAVINLANINHSSGRQNFNAVHVIGAKMIAQAARDQGIKTLVHRSSLANEASEYGRSKLAGEQAVLEIMPTAQIVRCANLYGESKGIFAQLAKLASLSPIIPLFAPFGQKTAPRFAPVYVADAAKAVAKIVSRETLQSSLYEFNGPKSYSAKELVEFTVQSIDRKKLILTLPSFIGTVIGGVIEFLSAIPILNLLFKPVFTRDMVKSINQESTPDASALGFEDLGIAAQTIEAVAPVTLEGFRKYGQFHQETTDEAH